MADRSPQLEAARSMELSVEPIGKHTGVRYGGSHRVLPTATLRTPRGAHVVAQILWDSEHPNPYVEEAAEDWNAARCRAIGILALDIALRLPPILDDDDRVSLDALTDDHSAGGPSSAYGERGR